MRLVAALEAEILDDDGLEALAIAAKDSFEFLNRLAGVQAVEGAQGHDVGDADGAKEAGGTADVQGKLIRRHGAQVCGVCDGVQFRFVYGVIAAEEGDRWGAAARQG